MKTITFYSYKGGTGRSLATAQLAVTLARFGKSVFVIDFDLEAPGVEHKFRTMDHATIADFDFGLINCIDIFRRTGELQSLENKIIPIGPRISLLPAGNAFSPDFGYWKIFSDVGWIEFMTDSSRSWKFFSKLKDQIKEFHNPDYLLIDSRSGVNELSGICTRLLADAVVFLSVNHEEGLRGTNLILRSLQNAREAGERVPDSKHFVLSRLPHHYFAEGKLRFLPKEKIDDIKQNAENTINLGLTGKNRAQPVYIFSSDPNIEIKEHLVIQFTGEARSSVLARDYVVFFSDLIPEIENDLRKLVREVQVLRPFMLIEEEGRMINPEDDHYNIALRVDTLQTFFTALYESTYKREKEHILNREKGQGVSVDTAEETAKSEAAKIAVDILFEAGQGAVENFSNYLKETWEEKKKTELFTPSLKRKLDDWCYFDSTVGFGKFENQTWGEGKEGRIRLTNNFLVHERSKDDHNLCAFMRGYITHILQAIFEPGHVEVMHDLGKDCGQYKDTDPKVCDFRFKVST